MPKFNVDLRALTAKFANVVVEAPSRAAAEDALREIYDQYLGDWEEDPDYWERGTLQVMSEAPEDTRAAFVVDEDGNVEG